MGQSLVKYLQSENYTYIECQYVWLLIWPVQCMQHTRILGYCEQGKVWARYQRYDILGHWVCWRIDVKGLCLNIWAVLAYLCSASKRSVWRKWFLFPVLQCLHVQAHNFLQNLGNIAFDNFIWIFHTLHKIEKKNQESCLLDDSLNLFSKLKIF